jgi:ATP-dependent Clp protease ATP-binding subunit ClpB
LDEVEKAHPDVFNILLQVLDDGRLTDGQGRTVDFKNTIIIMTSNLGSDVIQQKINDDYEDIKSAVMEIVGGHFRPEFINRVDDIVVFHPLKQAQIRQIAGLQVNRVKKRLLVKDIKLEVSEAALDFLGRVGFDPVYGARPLKRAIQDELENPLAQKLLAGEINPGQTIQVDVADHQLTFQVQ